MAKATEVRHIGIVVDDMEEALGFYRDMLGLTVARRMNEAGAYIDNVIAEPDVEVETVKLSAEVGPTLIELLRFTRPGTRMPEGNRALIVGPTHFAMTVDDLPTLYDQMSAKGIVFNCPPQTSPDGKAMLTYCQAPDGTLVELVQML
ncbi:MAG: VOC family protein [Rhizobiaceae bacterium]|nr:VOC family protein [Rhizobiaceae bacterium]